MGSQKRLSLVKILLIIVFALSCVGVIACGGNITPPVNSENSSHTDSSSTNPPDSSTHVHVFTHHEGKTAICTEGGYKAYDVCSGCGYSTYEEIPAYGHTEVIDKGEPATCIKPGITDGKHCSVCNTVLVKQEIIPATGHTPSDWIIDSQATYETAGSKHKECTVCHVTLETESIPAKKHSYSEWVITKKATCLEEGEKQRTCSECGDVEKQIIEKTTHTPSDWIIDKVATKTENGKKHKECTICGETTETEIIPATGSVGLSYSINDDGKTCSVTGIGECTDTEIFIPQVNSEGYIVISIAEGAFYACTNLISITIPDGVELIGDMIFDFCSGLESIVVSSGNTKYHSSNNCLIETARKTLIAGCKNSVIPMDGSVISIGDYAFGGCNNLKSITIPVSVTSIGVLAFGDCSGLESIVVSSGNTKYHSSNNCLIETASKTMVLGCKNSVIPMDGSVMSIGDYAFSGCINLKSITMPDNLVSIGICAFFDCSSLTSISIPDSVTSIGHSAFYGCNNLQYNIAGRAKFLGNNNNPFIILIELRDDTIDSLDIGYGTKFIGDSAFSFCYNLKSITIPDSVISIGFSAFLECGNLKSITIPDSVISIDINAFCGCSSLTSITIPDSVTSIGHYAFYDCSSLTSITIPDSVTSIGHGILAGCSSLQSIVVSDGNKNYHSAGNCLIETASKTLISACNNSVIPADGSVTSIGHNAFDGCRKIKSITIPDCVTSIGAQVFKNCSSLKSITIPDGVTSIGREAYYGCSSLTSITIPDSVMSIGRHVFSGCNDLKTVYYKGTAEQWDKISIDSYNDISYATRYYYSGTEPELNSDGTEYNGNYWHYDTDGVTPVIWKKRKLKM